MSDDEARNDRPAGSEDSEKVSGAVGSAMGAGATAGIGLAALGPLGGVIGALAGAVGGWWAGKGFERTLEDLDRHDDSLRQAHEGAAGATVAFDQVKDAYRLGYLAGRNPDYRGRPFEDVAEGLHRAWYKAHEHMDDAMPWSAARPAAERGFHVGRDHA